MTISSMPRFSQQILTAFNGNKEQLLQYKIYRCLTCPVIKTQLYKLAYDEQITNLIFWLTLI